MRLSSRTTIQCVVVALFLLSQAAVAGVIAGRVTTTDGRPLRAALITLVSDDVLHTETVFSDDRGRYRLATTQQGRPTLRVRAAGHRDATQAVELAPRSRLRRDLQLTALATPEEISDDLPASTHFTRIHFPTPIERQQFQTDCLTCHQIGNAFTRAARTPERWREIVTRMLPFSGYRSLTHLDAYAGALQNAFDGTPTVAPAGRVADDEALRARVTTWKLPGAIIAHDAEFSPADGRYYVVDQGIDVLYVVDPATNKVATVTLPEGGVPIGGRFKELGYPLPFDLQVRHGVHSLQFGPDGKLYITGAIGGEIGVFDLATRDYQTHRIGGDSLYPHTIRFDSKGVAWFTLTQSNQVGRFDPKTAKLTIVALPNRMARDDERTPLPYGIDIDPRDGAVWYSKLWANKIGRIDPETLEVREFEPPVVGPRRLRFDANGMLWIPGFGDGTLARLDPRTMQYRVFHLPTLGDGEVEAPYAVAVDPRTHDVWITANQSDRAFRFIQDGERFVSYPLPTRGSYFRDFFFPGGGRICAPSSPMPPAVTIEGGMHEVLCIDP